MREAATFFQYFMKKLGQKNPAMEKWGGKMMIRVQFLCLIFHIPYPHLSRNHFPSPGGGGIILQNKHPCVKPVCGSVDNIYFSVCLSICLSACQTCLSHKPVRPCICLSVYLFICLSFYLFIFLSVYLFICFSVFLFIRLPVYLSVW